MVAGEGPFTSFDQGGVHHGLRLMLLSLGEEVLQGKSECSPAWHLRGEDCPHGSVAAPLGMTAFTLPFNPTVVDCVAMFYSSVPVLIFLGITTFLLMKRSSLGALLIIYWFLVKLVAEESEGIGELLRLGDFARPPLSCKWSCGMPSGHSVEATAFFVWALLELGLKRGLDFRQKAGGIGIAAAVLIPIYWSRVQLHDHTLLQLLWGVPFGVCVAATWYLVLNSAQVDTVRQFLFRSKAWASIGGVDDYRPNHFMLGTETEFSPEEAERLLQENRKPIDEVEREAGGRA